MPPQIRASCAGRPRVCPHFLAGTARIRAPARRPGVREHSNRTRIADIGAFGAGRRGSDQEGDGGEEHEGFNEMPPSCSTSHKLNQDSLRFSASRLGHQRPHCGNRATRLRSPARRRCRTRREPTGQFLDSSPEPSESAATPSLHKRFRQAGVARKPRRISPARTGWWVERRSRRAGVGRRSSPAVPRPRRECPG